MRLHERHSDCPDPKNEPVVSYAPRGTEARSSAELAALSEIGGSVTRYPPVDRWHGRCTSPPTGRGDAPRPPTGDRPSASSSDRGHRSKSAIEAAERARPEWAALTSDFERSAVILLKRRRPAHRPVSRPDQRRHDAGAVQDGATKRRSRQPASWRIFGGSTWPFADQLMREQPLSPPGLWNRTELRPLDGFVFAVTPFNFTAIAGNLPYRARADGQHGGLEAWPPRRCCRPRSSSRSCDAAGLPPGVVNLVAGTPHDRRDRAPSDAAAGRSALHRLDGDLPKAPWSGDRPEYRPLPAVPPHRGRDRGQGLHLRPPERRPHRADRGHRSRRLRVPGSKVQRGLIGSIIPSGIWEGSSRTASPPPRSLTVKVGDVADFSNFMGAVIDQRTPFEARSRGYVDHAESRRGRARSSRAARTTMAEGTSSCRPTRRRPSNPHHRLMVEEIFGPVVTVFVYDDDKRGRDARSPATPMRPTA